MMPRLQLWKLLWILACALLVSGGLVSAQLTVNANTPYPSKDGSANTVMGVVGSSVASALLGSGTNALLWGTVPSDAINRACQHIVNTGSYELTATVHHNWGDEPDELTFQVENTGGCLAASDGSGTEIVAKDQNGRRSAIVCPANAGQLGCPVWITGDDVDKTYDNFSGNNRRRLLDDNGCPIGAEVGTAVGGVALSAAIVGLVSCATPLAILAAPICFSGMLLVTVAAVYGTASGAAVGCGVGILIENSCFPADALVQLQNGKFLPMMSLEVGQKVAVWKTSDSKLSCVVTYDEIYAFGHKDGSSKSSFYNISMIPLELDDNELSGKDSALNLTRTLEISGLHFVPTLMVSDSNKRNGKHQVLHKRAKDIRVGDYMWAVADGGLTRPHIVTAVSFSFKQGLYNPLTLSGTIVVNGVVASVHSDWFLDNIFNMLGISSSLPYAYQVVLAPPRLLYKVWPKELYVFVYNLLDAHFHVAELGTKFYGLTLASLGLATIYICSRFLK